MAEALRLQHNSGAAGGSLDGPLKLLREPTPIQSEDQLAAKLLAIEEACNTLSQLFSSNDRLDTGLLEGAVQAVTCGLSAVRQRLDEAGGQLAAVRRTSWSQALLAVADASLHSEQWHAAWHADPACGGKEAYLRTVGLARDILKDSLLPLLEGAAKQLTASTGFCLAAQFEALLEMGRTAGEIVGMRDVRHRLPGMRNFSVLNVLWNGIQRLWVAVPPEVQQDLERQGLGGTRVLGLLLGFIRNDIRTCHQLLEPGMGKLLLYWAQKAGHVLNSYPGAGPACWQAMLEVPLCAHQEVLKLAGVGSSGAAALSDALRLKVVPNTMRLLVASLNRAAAVAEDQLRVMLDGLRMRLSSPDLALPALRTALDLLHSAPALQSLARHHCVAVLGGVLDALQCAAFSPALQSAELRGQVVDAALLFLACCCHTAASCTSDEGMQAWERQLAAQTWERCQQQLFLAALQPHPLTASVLGSVWSDLAAVSSDSLLRGHVTALHDLLRLVAATEATEGHGPPSPLYLHLLELLACVLAAAPPAVQHAFFANFLQFLPSMREDACQLACLAAELRLAALVDGAQGGPAAASQVLATLDCLFTQLHDAAPALLRRMQSSASNVSGAAGANGVRAGAEGTYLAWLLEALRCAVVYAVSQGLQQGEECGSKLNVLAERLPSLLKKVAGSGMFAMASPLLGVLQELPLASQHAERLQQLACVLEACQQRPELAAQAAALVPALVPCPAPPVGLLRAVVSEQAPLLQHAGLEAFRRYAIACPDGNMAAVLEAGKAVDGFPAVYMQYSQRRPEGSTQPEQHEAMSWGDVLREQALGFAATLRRALEAHRAMAAANPGLHSTAEVENQYKCDSGVAAAVQDVMRSIQQLNGLLQASGSSGLDAAAGGTLQHCSMLLAQIIASSST